MCSVVRSRPWVDPSARSAASMASQPSSPTGVTPREARELEFKAAPRPPAPGASAALSAHVGAPDVDAGRQLLELLCEDGWDDKLIALWIHNNRGWMKDQSDSGPTMCVARIVFSYLADAQKAVNAAAAWRVKWARDPRLERLDLWRRIAGELENTCTDVN